MILHQNKEFVLFKILNVIFSIYFRFIFYRINIMLLLRIKLIRVNYYSWKIINYDINQIKAIRRRNQKTKDKKQHCQLGVLVLDKKVHRRWCLCWKNWETDGLTCYYAFLNVLFIASKLVYESIYFVLTCFYFVNIISHGPSFFVTTTMSRFAVLFVRNFSCFWTETFSTILNCKNLVV